LTWTLSARARGEIDQAVDQMQKGAAAAAARSDLKSGDLRPDVEAFLSVVCFLHLDRERRADIANSAPGERKRCRAKANSKDALANAVPEATQTLPETPPPMAVKSPLAAVRPRPKPPQDPMPKLPEIDRCEDCKPGGQDRSP